MATELQSRVAGLLEASLDYSRNKQAEIALRQEEQKPGFSICLLQIVARDTYSNTIRLSSALCFKNFLKRNWTDEDGNYKLPQQEVTAIKSEIIGLMISVPPNIQSQLGDAVGVIADSDFWERWDTLVDDLVSRLTPDNPQVNNGVLQVAHSIFKRWRPLFRSDELFTEILHVLGKFGGPFVSLLASTDGMIERHKADKNLLKQHFNTLNLMMKLFYDLSCQDLPPVFEDNLADVANLLQKYLTFDDPALHTDSDDESGPQEYVRSGILEILSLYVQKYEDAFGPYIGKFVESTWKLLTSVGPETKYDILVSKALQFLASVVRLKAHAEPFNNDAAMGQVLQGVIIPNISLRDSDVELFEDEPIEFIRRDLEGSDNDTRRRAATDFLRGLTAQFEQMVTQTVLRYTEHYLSEYNTNPSSNWKSKDIAVYLYSSIASKGVVTARDGVKTVNPLVNVLDFFQNNVANDLVAQSGIEPILQVAAIKYLYTFRTQISGPQWSSAFPLLVQRLASTNYVVYTYAAIAVERVLALTDASGQALVSRDVVQPLAKELLEHLFTLIGKEKTADLAIAATKVQENEFLMRCIMRVLIVVKDGASPLVKQLLQHFVEITSIISANPSNPRFCYYHFEAIGALVRFTASSEVATIESTIYPPFAAILQSDSQDFMPYVIQIFAALLETHPSAPLPEHYKPLIQPILRADFWFMKGNVPALVRLLTVMVERGASDFVQANQVEPILGIFKQLLSSKANEIYALDLLESIIANFPTSTLSQYYSPIMQLVLSRLQNSKTEGFKQRFVRFYHFISAKVDQGLGADFFKQRIDEVQDGVYVGLYLNIIMPGTPKLARPTDRKMAVISLTKTLTSSSAFAQQYKKGWAITCDRLLELLINPPVPNEADDMIAENDVDDMSFGVGFTPLLTIKKPNRDYWPEITNVKVWVSETLKEADGRTGGQIVQFVQERLSPESRAALVAYMQGG